MPVVLRFGRFKFIIYPKDHAPAHIHVVAGTAEAKFDLKTGKCIAAWGFAEHTLKHLQRIVRDNSDLLLEAWKDYEGED